MHEYRCCDKELNKIKNLPDTVRKEQKEKHIPLDFQKRKTRPSTSAVRNKNHTCKKQQQEEKAEKIRNSFYDYGHPSERKQESSPPMWIQRNNVLP